MEFRESFTLTENDPAGFGMQAVRFVCYRGGQPAPEWADQDPCKFLSIIRHVFFILTSSIVVSFFTYCTIHVDLSVATKDLVLKKAGSKIYYQLDYDVIVYFGLTELQAQLCWKAKVRC